MRFDRVNLTELSPGHYQIRYFCPHTGRDVRKRLHCSLRDARASAAFVESKLRASRRLTPEPDHPTPTLREALAHASRLSRARLSTRFERAGKSALWLRWM